MTDMQIIVAVVTAAVVSILWFVPEISEKTVRGVVQKLTAVSVILLFYFAPVLAALLIPVLYVYVRIVSAR